MSAHLVLMAVVFTLGALMTAWIAWIGVYALWWLGVAIYCGIRDTFRALGGMDK